MNTDNNPVNILTSPVVNEKNKHDKLSTAIPQMREYPRQKPGLVISVQSPTEEECKVDQMEKGYINKTKSYVAQWK